MGVCTTKQNGGLEYDPRTHSPSPLSSCRSIMKKSDSLTKLKNLTKQSSHELGIIIYGFIRQVMKRFLNHSLPSQIQDLCSLYFGSISHGTLIVESGKVFKLNIHDSNSPNPLFQYDSIILKKNATLTINRWNPKQRNGGVLDLEVFGDIVMEMGSKMTVTGRGYTGGDYGRNGESFSQNIDSDSKQSKTRKPNYGGGGGAQISIFGEFGAQSSCGGGGAYATQGKDGLIESQERNECIKYGIGGVTYGSAALTHLHLGSGGGCGYHFDEERNTLRANKGGSGGGAIRIQCHGSIQMRQDSKICANGTKGKGVMSGCGAGGSIHLRLGKRLSMDGSAKIEAMGGVNSTVKAGNGGEGRICIQFMDKTDFVSEKTYNTQINPNPYIS